MEVGECEGPEVHELTEVVELGHGTREDGLGGRSQSSVTRHGKDQVNAAIREASTSSTLAARCWNLALKSS